MGYNASLADAEKRLARMVHRRADDEEAERRSEARERVRQDDARCQSLAAEFQQDFAAFGFEPPMARADEWADDYHRRLLRGLQRRLPPRTELADPTMLDGVPDGPALANFASMVRAAAADEAFRPSPANMADSLDDPRSKRETIDPDTNQRRIEYYAKRSFIEDLSRKGRRVLRIIDPVRGTVLSGPPFSRVPG